MNEDNIYSASRSKLPTTTTDHVKNVPFSGGNTPYVMPRQTGTGATRGVQSLSGTLAITDPATGATISLGVLADGSLGMSITDSSGFVLFSLNGETWNWNNKNTNKNIMQVGKLPDSTYGMVVVKPTTNVSDAFS